jgi:hypothetical protein
MPPEPELVAEARVFLASSLSAAAASKPANAVMP